MPKVARDVMTPNPECIGESQSLLDAARKMAERGYGAMPICGDDNRLKGMLTDRDIVVKAIAKGKDPAGTRAGELGEEVAVGARRHDRGGDQYRPPEKIKPAAILYLFEPKPLTCV